jgi:hypothetical protein
MPIAVPGSLRVDQWRRLVLKGAERVAKQTQS